MEPFFHFPADAGIADLIDHTLLKAEASRGDIERLCAEAQAHGFGAVCVNPVWVPLGREALDGAGVKVATVVGFPLGANQPETKRAEAALAVAQGADELDMVAAIGRMKGGEWKEVEQEVAAVVAAAGGRPVKVIIESAVLTHDEIVRASEAAVRGGARFVKTSTGFHAAGGATADAVALIRRTVGVGVGVKASGGIRDCETTLRMLAAGASRLGTSSGVAIAGCLGADPRPLRALVEWPAEHLARCTFVRPAHPPTPQSY